MDEPSNTREDSQPEAPPVEEAEGEEEETWRDRLVNKLHDAYDWARDHKYTVVTVVAVLGFLTYSFWPDGKPDPIKADLSKVTTMIAEGQVKSAKLIDEQHKIQVQPKEGKRPYEAEFTTDGGGDLVKLLNENHTQYKVVRSDESWLWIIAKSIGWIIPIILLWAMVIFGIPKMQGMLSKSFVGNTDFRAELPSERFAQVQGADEAIEDLAEIVDSLKHPENYRGLRVDRGVLLYGPTGTGKTMLARAVAGEAGVPFYSLSGAGLTSMWGGGTTARIEGFFNKLRESLKDDQYGPRVVFIDELEGLASKRAGERGADRDTNSAVTFLLHQITEVFTYYPNVVIIGATNHEDRLDEAIKRQGRLGLHIAMPNPDLQARQKIIAQDSSAAGLKGINAQGLSYLTTGLSGAAVSALPYKAARMALREGGQNAIPTQHHFEWVAMEIAMGSKLRRKAVRSPEDQMIAAVHEMGHAVLAQASPYHRLLVTTTIPMGRSGGSTWCPMKEYMVYTEDHIMWKLAVAMGGRAAEANHAKPSTGCGHDIEHASDTALAAVCSGGVYDGFLAEVDLNRWQDDPMAPQIRAKVNELLAAAYKLAQDTLAEYEAFGSALQEALLDKRILHSDELAALALATSAAGNDPTE